MAQQTIDWLVPNSQFSAYGDQILVFIYLYTISVDVPANILIGLFQTNTVRHVRLTGAILLQALVSATQNLKN